MRLNRTFGQDCLSQSRFREIHHKCVASRKWDPPHMVRDALFSSQEVWSEIHDFPGYKISSWGRVLSDKTNGFITPTMKNVGFNMVGLMQRGVQRKRSLPLLVAHA